MSSRKGIMTTVIPANGITEQFEISGVAFKYYSCSMPEGCEVQVNRGDWEYIIQSHTAIPVDGVRSVKFRNLSASETTITWAVWNYPIADNLSVFTSSEMAEILRFTKGSVGASYGSATVPASVNTLLIPANPNRVSYTIMMPFTSPSVVNYFGYDGTMDFTKYAYALSSGQVASEDKYQGDVWVRGVASMVKWSEKTC